MSIVVLGYRKNNMIILVKIVEVGWVTCALSSNNSILKRMPGSQHLALVSGMECFIKRSAMMMPVIHSLADLY